MWCHCEGEFGVLIHSHLDEHFLSVNSAAQFADCDPTTMLIDTDHVRTLITPKTKAIIAVDMCGQVMAQSTVNP